MQRLVVGVREAEPEPNRNWFTVACRRARAPWPRSRARSSARIRLRGARRRPQPLLRVPRPHGNPPVGRRARPRDAAVHLPMSISASPDCASAVRARCTGDCTSITSSVGRTWASSRWPPQGAAVAPAEHGVRVDLRLVAVERDVADEREHLDLLVHRDALGVLVLLVEVAEDRAAERADRGGTVRR